MLCRILRNRRFAIKQNNPTKKETDSTRPFFMHPVVFLSGWLALGILFGFQESVEMSLDAWKVPLWMPFGGTSCARAYRPPPPGKCSCCICP
jgi:hypothetical protein